MSEITKEEVTAAIDALDDCDIPSWMAHTLRSYFEQQPVEREAWVFERWDPMANSWLESIRFHEPLNNQNVIVYRNIRKVMVREL